MAEFHGDVEPDAPAHRRNGPIDAAYMLEQTLITFLWRFRRRTPFLLATDMTPLFCAKRTFWYAVPEFDPSSPGSRLKQAITSSVYRSAFHLLPWSSAVRDSLVEDYAVPEKQITVLPPGMDLRHWHAPDRLTDLTNPVKKPFTVLHVGTDFHRKGADLLLALAGEPEFRMPNSTSSPPISRRNSLRMSSSTGIWHRIPAS